MQKKTKILSLLLAGVLAVTPAMETMAVEITENSETAESETEQMKEEGESETETEQTTEESESETETEQVPSESESETEQMTEESESETEQMTEESESETEQMTEESESETEQMTEESESASTEAEPIEIETETETETEAETEEVVLPGIENYTLSADQKDSIKELKNQMKTIANIREGVDCVEGELTFLADSEEEALKIAAGYGGELESFEYGVGVITLPENVGVVEALECAVASYDDSFADVVVAPAWPNYYNYAFTDEEASYSEMTVDGASAQAISSNVNDPFLNTDSSSYQWQHAAVGSYSAWNAGYTGKGVKVAVLDSGVISNHADLSIANHQNCVSSASSATDQHGHGTHVAGLIGAKKNNGKGGAGIAPDATIINVRVLNAQGSGTTADIMRGINYAVGYGVDIINMSLGGYFYNDNYETVIENAYKQGVAVFVASGNDGSSIATYPACYSGAIAIGATTPGNVRTAFSNYGSWVKFLAPGDNLYSTYKDGNYYKMSGTSQATPVAAGTAAVILSAKSDIQSKSGKAKVDALVAAMNKGKVNDIVSLPKALDIAVSYEKPKAPVFAEKSGTYTAATHTITINKTSSVNTIYYSVDGKNITYKDGKLSDNAIQYTGPVVIGNAARVTVKAMEINPVGIAGPVASETYTFKPSASAISVSGSNALLVGKSIKLTAEVSPSYAADKKVVWDISPKDKGVTVSNGTVKAVKTAAPGVYTVSVKSNDKNSTAVASFKVTVKNQATIKKIAFKKAKDTVFVGKNSVTYNLIKDKDNNPILDVTLADGTSKGTSSDVTWSSSDTKLATVANGVVTAKAAGSVKITATANDGSGIKGTFTLTIKQYATGIAISGSSVVAVGKSNKLTATVSPATTANKKLVWSVSPADQGVTVSNGTVKTTKTAKAGKYTITVTAADRTDGAAIASKTITVSDNAIQQIKLSDTKATIYRTKASSGTATSVQIKPEITAKTASGSAASSSLVEFTSSNPGIATVTFNGSVATVTATGKAAGTTKITCKAIDGSNKSATCTVTVANPTSKMFISAPVGQEQFNQGSFVEGAKIKLKANFESQYGKVGNMAVTWSSSNSDVVSVDKNGTITVNKANSIATITAKASDGATATFPINTYKNYKKLTLSVDLNKENYYIRPDHMYTFNVLFDGKTYNQGVYYPEVVVEVKDKDILQVIPNVDGRGTVTIAPTGKKLGSTSFTIRTNDGSGKKVTYKLAVLDKR